MHIVRQSTTRRLRMLSRALAMALATLVICSAEILPEATPPKLTTLYSFPGKPGGGFLEAGLVRDPGTGTLYGTTANGGSSGWGTVFSLKPPATAGNPWTQKTLYTFTGGADGASPEASLAIGTGGVLFGTTALGGSAGKGTAFSLTPTASGPWTEKVIHAFTGGTDGSQPEAALVLAPTTGVLYGTTYAGGTAGFGTVFSLAPATGGTYTPRVLYSFTGGNDGGNPVAGVALSASKTLYGTTYTGGTSGYGTVYQLVPSGGNWTQSVLYSFTNSTDGNGPESGVTIQYVSSGSSTVKALYGTTFWAGSSTGCLLGGFAAGCGTVYSLTPPATSGPWTFKLLYSFKGAGTDGAHPSDNLQINGSGQIFGTTFSGGSTLDICFGGSYPGCGTIFRLTPPTTSGGAWTEAIVHVFIGKDGGGPNGVTPGANGIYYGSTYVGGLAGGYGTIFQLTPQSP